jgi:hypothetical protein
VRIERGMEDGKKIVFKEKADEMPGCITGDVVLVVAQVCVCVCVGERERERERECVCVCVFILPGCIMVLSCLSWLVCVCVCVSV